VDIRSGGTHPRYPEESADLSVRALHDEAASAGERLRGLEKCMDAGFLHIA